MTINKAIAAGIILITIFYIILFPKFKLLLFYNNFIFFQDDSQIFHISLNSLANFPIAFVSILET